MTSVTWNYDGSLAATAAKDKALRVFDPRGGAVVAEGTAHQGAKGWRAVWLGARDRILSVGFTKVLSYYSWGNPLINTLLDCRERNCTLGF